MPKSNITKSRIEKLMNRVVKLPNGCWAWTGCIDRDGYGQTRITGTSTTAHRAVYELSVGPIPQGHQIDHICHDPRQCSLGNKCQHRRCCNPSHLESVMPIENMRRGHGTGPATLARRQSKSNECPHGHLFTEENTYHNHRSDGTVRRECRECKKLWMRASRKRLDLTPVDGR